MTKPDPMAVAHYEHDLKIDLLKPDAVEPTSEPVAWSQDEKVAFAALGHHILAQSAGGDTGFTSDHARLVLAALNKLQAVASPQSGLARAVQSIQSRPAELRGSFKSKSIEPAGADTAGQGDEGEAGHDEAYAEGFDDGRAEAEGATVEFWRMMHRWATGRRIIDPHSEEMTAQDFADAILTAFGDRKPVVAALSSQHPDTIRAEALEEVFAKWWSKDGQYLDPDTSDVPWFDKRRGLAEYAYRAGRNSQAQTGWLIELGTRVLPLEPGVAIDVAITEIKTLRARVGELEGALRPFAAIGELLSDEDGWSDNEPLGIEADGHFGIFAELKSGDFRRAHAALSPPLEPEAASPAGEGLREGIEALISELVRWDRWVIGSTQNEKAGANAVKEKIVERLRAMIAARPREK